MNRSIKIVVRICFVFISMNIGTIVLFAQSNTLPEPSGNYSVGFDYFCFTDSNRIELFDNNSEKYRDITVKVWYPTDVKPSKETLYFYNPDIIVKYFDFPEIYKNLTTNSTRAVPLSQKEKTYPVLIFNHGWGEHFAQNTILMEELASHGYLVFSIAHHYECKFSFYPDGKFIPMDFKSNRFQKMWQEQQNPKAMELLIKMFGLTKLDEQKQILIDQSNALPTLLKESPGYWAKDISFFIDQLESMNDENKLFKDRLNLGKIAVFGMSMGGLSAIETCLTDKRIKACVDIDGGLNSLMLERNIPVPVLFLNSKRYLGYGNLFTCLSTSDSYSLAVKGSDHYNFTDYSVYPVPIVKPLLGSIEPNKTIEIMNAIVLAFFDKYLKDKKGIDLIKQAKKYNEIEIATNIEK